MLRRTPDDAQVLLVRACASDVLGDHRVARELFRRAEAMIAGAGDGREPAVLQIARLFIADERAAVADASAKVRQMLLDADSTELGDRAALNYLLGWTEIRHRGQPAIPLEYFSAAARGAELGDRELAKRSLGHLAFGQTWAGRFSDARSALASVEGAEHVSLPWSTYAGGSAAAAAGKRRVLGGRVGRGDPGVRDRDRERGARTGRSTSIARMMIAYASAETGDVAACR
ncbi:hypothetical protein [Microbacterium sp. Se63.02b]|uniref:hypothetical protein n=1 Tax=Microbacterium sp. Se63.02b TaxID=2709304 RepID=UPI0016054A04|nr:hypothetical protein [Microbacterium sp. Se63.02b]QNA92352.1 hypothetical protein G4G29_08155 [Microbacterium sp. Se63.02b]